MFFNSSTQIDFLARSVSVSIVVALTLTLILLKNVFEPFGAVLFLIFTIVFALIFIFLSEIVLRICLQKIIPSQKKAVMITGCDRGFGFGFAKRLGDAGFQVFAGCLDPFRGGGLELSQHPKILCLKMDVTKQEEIDLARDYVENHLLGNELWAVINNAGISKGSDIETTSMQKILDVLDVNLVGPIRVTKAFLPLLRASKGRVINIASAAGRLTLPGFLPYSISKNALIAFSEGLRMEMRRHGVQVVSVEPWIYRTKLADICGISKQMESDWQSCDDRMKSSYNDSNLTSMKEAAKEVFKWGVSFDLDEVTDTVHEAVVLQYPPYRYSPGKWYLNCTIWCLNFIPKPVADFAFCHFIFKR